MKIDAKKIQLSEKDLENWLWDNEQELPYNIETWLARQYKVPSGIIDIIGVTSEGDIVIVELKNHVPDANALTQISRYAKDVERILMASQEYGVSIHKAIVGVFDNISNQLQFEADALDIKMYSMNIEFDITINGAWSWTEEHGHNLADEYKKLSQDNVFLEIFQIGKDYVLYSPSPDEETKNE